MTPPKTRFGGGRFSQIYFLILFGRPPYFAEIESKSEDTFWSKNQIHKSITKKFQVIWKKSFVESPSNFWILQSSKSGSHGVSSQIFLLSQSIGRKIFSTYCTVMIQRAIDNPDPREAFEYPVHGYISYENLSALLWSRSNLS